MQKKAYQLLAQLLVTLQAEDGERSPLQRMVSIAVRGGEELVAMLRDLAFFFLCDPWRIAPDRLTCEREEAELSLDGQVDSISSSVEEEEDSGDSENDEDQQAEHEEGEQSENGIHLRDCKAKAHLGEMLFSQALDSFSPLFLRPSS